MQKQAFNISPGFVEALLSVSCCCLLLLGWFWEEAAHAMSGDSVHPPGWTFPLKPCQNNDFICCFVLLMFPHESGIVFGFVLSNPWGFAAPARRAQPDSPNSSLSTSLQQKGLYTQVFNKLVIRHRGNESCLDHTATWREFPLLTSDCFCSSCSTELSVPSHSSVKIKGLCFPAWGNVYGDNTFQLEIWTIRFLVSDIISAGARNTKVMFDPCLGCSL